MRPCNLRRPGWRWGFGNRAEANAFIRAIKADHGAAAGDLVDVMFHTPPTPDTREAMIAEIVKTPAAAAAELERDDLHQDWRDVLENVPLPTLVCAGAHSQVFPNEALRFLAARIPKADLVVFEDSGHCPFIEEHDRFNQVVREFARSLP